jgi:excisionase family DNA binding protein
MDTTEQERLLVTVDQVAARLGIGRSTAYALVMTGRIPSVKIGRCRRVSCAALQAFVDQLEYEA